MTADVWQDKGVSEQGSKGGDTVTLAPFELPKVWRASDLKPSEQPRWLAKGRIPRAAISLLVGDEGIGKSLMWVWLTAAVTTGKPLPEFGIPARTPEDVVIVITEDEWSSTVLPRLTVAGADIDRVHVICTDDDGSGAPIFPRDMYLIDGDDREFNPGLVVVDAWLDTVPGGMSVKDPQQARNALHPWKEAATKTGAAIFLLTHTNRNSTGNARDKYGITAELRKKARMTLFAQQDDEGHLVIGPEKSNTSRGTVASMFRIDSVQHFKATEDDDGTIPRLVYIGDSERTAREHIQDAFSDSDDVDGADCTAWLKAYIEDGGGSREANDVYQAADANGFSKDKAKRAKRDLGIKAAKVGKGPWLWTL